MAMTINTNLFALNAQRNLRKTQNPLQKAMQRLSSGLRINSAKDDAAGMAIATRMTRQITGLSVSMRNANDGISFAQTAEGAMDEMTTNIQRIYELAEQAASYNTSADRASLNTEVQELIAELNRVVSQTRYNGEQFLNQAKSIDIQVGVEVKETINISTSNVSPSTMGVNTSYNSTVAASDMAAAAYIAYDQASTSTAATLAGTTLGAALDATEYKNNSQAVVNRINEYTGDTGVTAFSFGNSLALSTAAVVAATGAAISAGYITINGTQIGSFTSVAAGSATQANLISAINNQSTTTGVVAVAIDSSGGIQSSADSTSRVVLANTTGAAISVSLDSTVTGANDLTTSLMASTSMSVSAGQNGKILFSNDLTDSTSVSMNTVSGAVFGLGTAAAAVTLTATSINSVTITNTANANIAILAAKQGLDTLNSERATLGAKLNRFESTIRNLDNVRENLTAARSRILDADFAEETANMTKAMIMQQAGISVLSQANSLPQNILALLQ